MLEFLFIGESSDAEYAPSYRSLCKFISSRLHQNYTHQGSIPSSYGRFFIESEVLRGCASRHIGSTLYRAHRLHN